MDDLKKNEKISKIFCDKTCAKKITFFKINPPTRYVNYRVVIFTFNKVCKKAKWHASMQFGTISKTDKTARNRAKP